MKHRKPRRRPPNVEQIAAMVARIELIPADRPLTTGELRMIDSLTARLRQRSADDRSEELRDLLRRVSAVRAGKRVGACAPVADGPTDKGRGPVAQLHRELSALADNQALEGRSIARLVEIVNETARLVDKGPAYRRLYERALHVQRKALRPPQHDRPTGNSRGLVKNPELLYGGREVLGGAPSTGRRY